MVKTFQSVSLFLQNYFLLSEFDPFCSVSFGKSRREEGLFYFQTFHCQLSKCIRDQCSHSVALFQQDHAVRMDVNLMRVAHFQ